MAAFEAIDDEKNRADVVFANHRDYPEPFKSARC
jgi:hypothetical protein